MTKTLCACPPLSLNLADVSMAQWYPPRTTARMGSGSSPPEHTDTDVQCSNYYSRENQTHRGLSKKLRL